MGPFLLYMIKVAFCQTVFYLAYKLLLSRDTFHAFNRAVLLFLLAASLLLPLVRVTAVSTSPVNEGFAAISAVVMNDGAVVSDASLGVPPLRVLALAYLLGLFVFLALSLVSLVRMLSVMRRGRVVTTADGIRITVLPGDTVPFSWFGRIVISERDYAFHPREIVIHERAHVALRHSWDVAACNLATVFCWPSPAAWLLKSELRDVHEYQADSAVLRSGVDASAYQLLLIRKAVGERVFAMANSLNHYSLKKRIVMMKSSNSSPWLRAKAVLVLPFAAVVVAVFANADPAPVAFVAERSAVAVSPAGPSSSAAADTIFISKATTASARSSATIPNTKGRVKGYVGKKDTVVVAGKKELCDKAVYGFGNEKPLLIIDGKEVEGSKLDKLDVQSIKSVIVLKGDKHVGTYGEKAKNGVLLITTKRAAASGE